MRLILLLAAVSILAVPGPARADAWAEGLESYDGGDWAAAHRAWAQAADKGNSDAMAALAGLYAEGLGVRADLNAAAQWYRRAARLGNAAGQLNLGEMLAFGRGVARDKVGAYMWLGLAAAQGREWARARLGVLAREMTAAEIKRAKAAMASWKPQSD